jgi:predicted NBD/HSP70 family sugar kinase
MFCDLSCAVLAREYVELREAHVDEVPAEAATKKPRLAANLQRFEGRWTAYDLATRLGLTIRLKNDINLAALGEQWLGVARA